MEKKLLQASSARRIRLVVGCAIPLLLCAVAAKEVTIDRLNYAEKEPQNWLTYGEHRKGDNLYTASIVALKSSTGEIVWHFQTVPHDVWDYDAAYECILVDLPVNGRPRKLLIQPNKSGYVFVVDRTNGEFVGGWKYVDTLTWSSRLDSKGVPQERKEPLLNRPVFICPNYLGGRSFNQATFNPKTRLLYNIGVEWCGEYTAREQEMVPGRGWMGGSIKVVPPPSGRVTSHLDAFEPLTGKKVWSYEAKYPLLAALVSTGGDLVLTGDPEGNFFALHAGTGKKLWSFPTGSGHRRRAHHLRGEWETIHRDAIGLGIDRG